MDNVHIGETEKVKKYLCPFDDSFFNVRSGRLTGQEGYYVRLLVGFGHLVACPIDSQ